MSLAAALPWELPSLGKLNFQAGAYNSVLKFTLRLAQHGTGCTAGKPEWADATLPHG